MDKTKGELLQEELMMKPVNGTSRLSDEALDKAEDFSVGYKKFMDAAKIEIEAVKEAIALLEKNGYHPFERGKKYQPGERFYYNNRGKSLIFGTMGKRPIEKGVKILAAHVDSPRLDIKPSPLFENCELGYLRPHYYGGIKKYQWPTIPLALHGDVYKKDGSVVSITIGEDENDPIFCVTDLLPHLSSTQRQQTLAEAFKGESLNILIGSRQFKDDKASEKVKLNLMRILNEKYGITERDFLGAELSCVPALKARDLGLDRSMIGAYGHDDRVCAYTEMMAEIDNQNPEWTSVVIFADKEEVGSDGNTGMHSRFLEYFLADLAEPFGVPVRRVPSNSKCLSADVSAAYDPSFADAYEKQNSSFLNYGVCVVKYTGSGGKGGTNDCNARFTSQVCAILDKADVVWQFGELGKVDQGGGGTVAKFISELDVDTIDIGVPVLCMHAPMEIISKVDLYETYRGFYAFLVAELD